LEKLSALWDIVQFFNPVKIHRGVFKHKSIEEANEQQWQRELEHAEQKIRTLKKHVL